MRNRTMLAYLAVASGVLAAEACGSSDTTKRAPIERPSLGGEDSGGAAEGGRGATNDGGTSAAGRPPMTSGGTAGSSGSGAGGLAAAAGNAGEAGSASGAGGANSESGATVTLVTPQFAFVRQGQGSFTIEVEGTGLTGATGFDLEGLNVLQVEPGATDTRLTLIVGAPHGSALGPKNLSFSVGGTKVSKKAVVTVTPICAGPAGNDLGNRGSSDSPFRTFKKAIGASASGDTVSLADGTYDTASGEDWQQTIPSGVTLQGQGGSTLLSGPGSQGATPSMPGLTFAGDANVENLTVSYFQDGADITHAGSVTFDSVALVSNAHTGLDISAAATVKVTGASSISKNLYHGINVNDLNAALTLDGAEIDSNRQSGIFVNSASATVTVKNGEINQNEQGAFFYSVNPSAMPLTASFDGTKIWNNGYYSVYVAFGYPVVTFNKVSLKGTIDFTPANAVSATLSLTDSTLVPPEASAPSGAQNSYGVIFGAGALNVSTTSISGYTTADIDIAGGSAVFRGSALAVASGGQYGIYITAGKLDLGTALVPGNNVFTAPNTANTFGLMDSRAAALIPITSSSTTFNGDLPASGKIATGPSTVNGEYKVSTSGNQIAFY